MMGPNFMKIFEEILKDIRLDYSMRVLYLGCGR